MRFGVCGGLVKCRAEAPLPNAEGGGREGPYQWISALHHRCAPLPQLSTPPAPSPKYYQSPGLVAQSPTTKLQRIFLDLTPPIPTVTTARYPHSAHDGDGDTGSQGRCAAAGPVIGRLLSFPRARGGGEKELLQNFAGAWGSRSLGLCLHSLPQSNNDTRNRC